MDLSDLRVLDISESLWLFIISLLILGFILVKTCKGKNKLYIPLILSLYGCAFCWCIIFVFGEGYTGIPFVLISWLFIFSSVVSLLAIIIKHFKKLLRVKGYFSQAKSVCWRGEQVCLKEVV